jgi:pimeloyl-ACP methyl ester carboxylesterase
MVAPNYVETETQILPAKSTGEGTPLVLVPGGLTGWMSWEPHVARLAANRRVISVQLLSVAYGLEKRPLPSDYSLRTESEALAATVGLDIVGLAGPVDVVAWSYGAAIALDFALHHPERVLTLTLIEPPAVWALGLQKPRGPEYESALALGNSIGIHDDVSEAQLEQFARAVGLCPPGQAVRDLPQWPVWLRHRQSLCNTGAAFRHEDDPARLRAFYRPVLLVKGTGSAEFLHQIVDALAAQLPNAQTVELPGGHAPQIVSMDSFLERLALFHNSARGLFRPL